MTANRGRSSNPNSSTSEVLSKEQPTQNAEGTGKLAVTADGLDASAEIKGACC